MNLNPVAKKISELPAFIEFSRKQVDEVNGASYAIESVNKEDGIYKYRVVVLDQRSVVLKAFEIESYLEGSKIILEGISA